MQVMPQIGLRWSLCDNGNPDKIYSWSKTFYVLKQWMGCSCASILKNFAAPPVCGKQTDRFQNAIFLL